MGLRGLKEEIGPINIEGPYGFMQHQKNQAKKK
jgi:hypothetical protein